jgi:hypothetical protein
VASLLDRLREAGAHEQAAALTARLPAAGMSGLFLEQKGAADQSRSGREADGTPAAPWRWEDLEVCGTSHSQLLQPENEPSHGQGSRTGRRAARAPMSSSDPYPHHVLTA